MIAPEKLEGIIQKYLVHEKNDKAFITELKKLNTSSVELESLEPFGDPELGQKVGTVQEDISMKKPYDKDLTQLKMYINAISGKNFSDSRDGKENESEVNNMVTDKELNMVSEENVKKINEKVMDMDGTLAKVEDKLDNLVEQQKSILKNIDPESQKTTDEKLKDTQEGVKTLAAAFSDLCDYLNSGYYNFDGMPAPGGAPMPPAGGAPAPGGAPAGDPSAMAAQIAQQMGLMPGAPGYNEFIAGYMAALGMPPAGGAPAGAPAPGGAPAPMNMSETPAITYSELHNAFLANNGDIYTYSEDKDGYFNADGEQLLYSDESDVFYSEKPVQEPEYVASLFSVDGEVTDLYATDDALFSEDGDVVVYNEDVNAFFSESGDTLYDYETFSDMGGFLELVETDPAGNAIFFSTETGDYYYYSIDEDMLFNEEEVAEAQEGGDDSDEGDEGGDNSNGEETEVIHVNGNDGNKIIVIDDDNSMDTKVEGDTVTISDDDGFDELEVDECDSENGDAVCHSVITGDTYFYSAQDKAFYTEEGFMAEFSEENTKSDDTVNFAEDNRSNANITTFSFIDDMSMVDSSNAQERYNALQNYLSTPVHS